MHWPANAPDGEDGWQKQLGDTTEYFLARKALPVVTPIAGSDGNFVPGDGSVDAQARFQLLMRCQLPKAFFLTSTAGVPEIITLAAKGHEDTFVSALVRLDSLKSAQAMLPSIGFDKSEIKSVYEDVSDGEFITIIIDPYDGRKSPVHRDIGGIDRLMKEFAEATKFRAPIPDDAKGKKTKKKTKKTKKKSKKKTKSKSKDKSDLKAVVPSGTSAVLLC